MLGTWKQSSWQTRATVGNSITLHGGPRHGDVVAVPREGASKVTVVAQYYPYGDETEEEEVRTVRGYYTPVHGSSEDYEWTGWDHE